MSKAPEQSFKLEDLTKGKIANNKFQVDYLPMWQFLDNMDRKIPGGLKSLQLEKVFEGIYEFATIQVSLDKADMQARIDNLNTQNLKWFSKADTLEAENTVLKQRLSQYEQEPISQKDQSQGISLST